MTDQFAEQVARRDWSERRHPETREQLLRRVMGEFKTLAGLSLSRPQAYRLFCLEPQRCERILQELIGRGLLGETEEGHLRRNAS